ncbi:MAG: hypothetical protein II992_07090 [Lachnospiraceae bacterium]|nr:hypothetical protein [Lachnospiraceae bacterium]
MTENEALKRMKMCIGISPSENIVNSFKMISDALEELQQYRELGTIEEILKVFNNQRTIIAAQHETLEQYRKIGTIEEFKALKEKSTPMKPIPNISPEEGKVVCWTCPSCKKKYWNGYYFPPLTFDKVCTNCLQAIDWD